MIHVDTESFFVIVLVAAVAAITVALVPARFAPPVVVLELFLGIVVGPDVFSIASTDSFIEFFSNLGLGMLFFFAGYEVDFERIRGRPMELGGAGWLLSVVIAFGIASILAAAGVIDTFLYVGAAMATTAIGTLIPILRDNGELKTKFGTYLLAAGGAGEFGPVLLVTLFLSTDHPLHAFSGFSLLEKSSVLTAQAPELLSLIGGQALALAGVDVGLLDPVAQRLVGDAQVARDLGDRALRGAGELHGFTPELRRLWRLGGWHRLLLA
jgi:Kef-type K+ transport system membrane component KefB